MDDKDKPDEINDWSEIEFRRFREEVLPVIRDHYQFLIEGDLGVFHQCQQALKKQEGVK